MACNPKAYRICGKYLRDPKGQPGRSERVERYNRWTHRWMKRFPEEAAAFDAQMQKRWVQHKKINAKWRLKKQRKGLL